MRPSNQDIFNQYRENVIIETVQAISRSAVGPVLAFKGGTALKLFFDLPRYSEDLDYDGLPGAGPEQLMEGLNGLARRLGWEITDAAVKRRTVLFEMRFAGPQRNFHLKVEVSTRKPLVPTAVMSLRGVPVTTLAPARLMTEKLIAFADRRAGRDVFDAWFILSNGFGLEDELVTTRFGGYRELYETVLAALDQAEPRKVLRDTGKLLGPDHRNWVSGSFINDFKKMVRSKIQVISLPKA